MPKPRKSTKRACATCGFIECLCDDLFDDCSECDCCPGAICRRPLVDDDDST